jgi:hypothetical protein
MNVKTLSQIKISIKHVIRELKKFDIIGEKNKNKRKRFELRMRLMSGIYNWGR